MKILILLTVLLATATAFANIENGLVAHWTFDNDEDNAVFDESGNGLHGTAYNVTYEQGPVSLAAVFNGEDSRIYFPDNTSAPPDTINTLAQGSISLWFKFYNSNRSLPFLYYGESDHTRPHNSLIIEVGHGQNPDNTTLYFTIVHRQFCFTTPVGLVEATWYHFAAVVREDGNTGYLNGEEMTNRRYLLGSNATYTEFFANITRPYLLTLGYGRYGREAPFFHLDGSLDDVRIYNRPLEAEEVRELFALGFAPDLAEKPEVFPAEGNYYEPLELTISTATPEAAIYYTLDGSEPTEDSILYEAPLLIDYHTLIKARAFAEDYLPSETASNQYYILYPPRNLTAEPTMDEVKLFWDEPWSPENYRTDILGYSVFRSYDGNEFEILTGEPVIETMYVDPDIQIGNYRYYVTVVYEQGESQASEIVSIVAASAETILPANYTELLNAYPNPFNPQTLIRWHLAKSGHAKLTVYDVKGRITVILVDEYRQAGFYETMFDARGLSSGVYLFMLETDEVKLIKKTVLMK